MVHPATRRVILQTLRALNTPLDIGYVFAPRHEGAKAYAKWQQADLSIPQIMKLLPEAAASNVRGGNIFMRLGPSSKEVHPGIIMLDDLTRNAVHQLTEDGFEPSVVIETSPGNFQAWIKLTTATSTPYKIIGLAIHELVARYGADPRAVSPRQPGRAPGFTNRKLKHQRSGGSYPFVKLQLAEQDTYASQGNRLIEQLSKFSTVRDELRYAPETPPLAANRELLSNQNNKSALDLLYNEQRKEILFALESGHRTAASASQSELDFSFACAALYFGYSRTKIETYISAKRPTKSDKYAASTVNSAHKWIQKPSYKHRPPRKS